MTTTTSIIMTTKKRKMAETLFSEGNAHDDGVHPAGTSTRPQGLACVFSKRYPSEMPSHLACLSPFTTIPRLKEHLYRCHRRPLHCLRCKTVFQAESEYQQHLNAPERCAQAPSSRKVEGLTDDQVAELKRKRRKECESTDQKWKRIYEIIFPEVNPTQIPSPYWEIRSRFRGLEQLEAYLRERVKPVTEQIMSTEFGQKMILETRSQLPQLVLSVFNNICAEFRLHEGLGSSEHATEVPQAFSTQGDAEQDTAGEPSSALPTSIIMNPHDIEAQVQRRVAMSLPLDVADGGSNSDFSLSQPPEEIGAMLSTLQPDETTAAEPGLINFTDDPGWDFSFDAGSFLHHHDFQQ